MSDFSGSIQKKPSAQKQPPRSIWLLTVLLWTGLILLLSWTQVRESRSTILGLAVTEGTAAYNQDLVYRRWSARHGGVYVPASQETPPNPYLAHLPYRDQTTTDGLQLTLINPAYMTRQVHEMARDQSGVIAHITSLRPLRPENAPDTWERRSLESFEAGQPRTQDIQDLSGESYLRLMFPMFTEPGCLKCHGDQGYKVGDIRGGISVSIPFTPYQQAMNRATQSSLITHGLIWAAGLVLILLARTSLNRQFSALDRARSQAQNAQQRFQLLFDKAGHGSLVMDPASGLIKGYNQQFADMFGLPAELQAPLPINDLVATPKLAELNALPADTGLEVLVTRGDQPPRHLEIRTSPLEYAGKSYLYGFVYDISARKQAEKARQQSEETFYKAFANAPVMMSISDLETGRYLDVNRRFTETSGYSRAELIGVTSTKLGIISQESRRQMLSVLLREGRLSGVEVETRRRDGNKLLCSFFGELITIQGERRLLSLALDITEHRHLEDQLHQAEKLQALGQLAGGIAHDFNNQIAGILGYSELLEKRLGEGKLKSFAQSIRQAAQNASATTRQLLAFSRKETHLLKPVSINQLIGEVVSILQHSLDKKIRVSQQIRAQQDMVLGDASLLQNVILNIALNARDAMPDGGDLIFETALTAADDRFLIDSQAEDLKKFLHLSITDTGCGMDAETRKRIFEPFFTTKALGKGTGMGLPSAYGTIRNHGGQIRVDSSPGVGSCFNLYLPLLDQQGLHDHQQVNRDAVRGSASLLIVDDEEMVRQLMAEMLGELGYRVHLCSNGREAIDYFRQNWQEVDLVLLDMIMPQLDGRGTFTELRRINPQVPVMIASGYSSDSQVQSLLKEPLVDLVTKPCNRIKLSEKIARALESGTRAKAERGERVDSLL